MLEMPRFVAEMTSGGPRDREADAADAVIVYFEEEQEKSLDDTTARNIVNEVADVLFRDTGDWEVIDRTRKPLSRVICRTNRADAMMIVEALNDWAYAGDVLADIKRIEHL